MDTASEFVATTAQRLDVAVASHSGRSRGQAQSAVRDGAVYIDGKRCRIPAQLLQPGQQVRVEPAAPAARRQIDGGQLRVVHRDDRLLVVDKPAGLPTQPPPRGGDALSLRVHKLLAQSSGRPPWLGEVHRLDRDASGLVVYGLDREATALLAAQFRSHAAGRRYVALVRSHVAVPPQTIDEPLGDDDSHGGSGREDHRQTVRADGAPAVTHVRPLGWDPAARLALLDLAIETGRTHQIRVHLSWAVGPILGDGWYGDPDGPMTTLPTGRIALHAHTLSLRHPSDQRRCSWHAPPPADFWPDGTELRLPDGFCDGWPQAQRGGLGPARQLTLR